MNKLIVSLMALGTLAMGGAASAQGLFGRGDAWPQVFGDARVYPGVPGSIYKPGSGQPPPGSVVIDANGNPRVIAATGVAAMPGGTVVESADGGQVTLDANGTYLDRFGRRIQVDATGRHTPVTGLSAAPVRGLGAAGVAQSRRFAPDRDGDGVPDAYDRYPDDRRYR